MEETLPKKGKKYQKLVALMRPTKRLRLPAETGRGDAPWTSFWRISVNTGKRASSKLPTVAGLALQVMRTDRQRDSNR